MRRRHRARVVLAEGKRGRQARAGLALVAPGIQGNQRSILQGVVGHRAVWVLQLRACQHLQTPSWVCVRL